MNFIEELYYGNINSNEKRYKATTLYDKALSIFTANEDKLIKKLSGEHLKLFNELAKAVIDTLPKIADALETLRTNIAFHIFNVSTLQLR